MSESGVLEESVLSAGDREALSAIFGERVHFDRALAPYTSWKIGGPADAFVTIENSTELAQTLGLVQRSRLPWFVLGSGSNLLIGDGGIRGIVFRLAGEFARIEIVPEEREVIARVGASASMPLFTAQAASAGAIGIDGLAGIPGSVGGSLRMNAGTDREIGEFVREVWVQAPAKPEAHAVTPQFFYRHTTLARDAVVAWAVLAFERGDPGAARERMQQRLVRRRETQPLAFPNAGSCFRNPPGDKAGRLIEAAGAKGLRVGGAEVSNLHANFIVNTGEASAADVAALLARVRRRVADRFGVELQLEVHFAGAFV
jgi:UDP-N-acetylmuramate dehydrogenase